MTAPVCPICRSAVQSAGTRASTLDPGRRFNLLSCPNCGFAFVEAPRSDFEVLYDEAYYEGSGADSLVDYKFELQWPDDTVRVYEWRGICSIARELQPGPGRWLDFGCGTGGLVRYALRQGFDIVGHDEGWGAGRAASAGIPILSREELFDAQGPKFDFISAVEVIEHIADPMSVLRDLRTLLNPGGTLFITTGNAAPWRGRLTDWSYTAVPDIHVSFFEPRTLDFALRRAGFVPAHPGYLDGFTDIIRFKVMKNLRFRRRSALADLLPWSVLSRLVDRKYAVSAHPVGIAQ